MDDKLTQLIISLADRLGTTAEHLFGVMIRQAKISAAGDLLGTILSVIALYMWFLVVSKKTAAPIPERDEFGNRRYPDWDEAGMFFAWASFYLFLVIWVFIAAFSILNILTALINPEYWALKQFLP